MKRPAILIAFTIRSFAYPGCVLNPWKVSLTASAAVDRVRALGAEPRDVEMRCSPADFLVRCEPDPHGSVPNLGVRHQIGRGRHDLGDAGLVVGAEQRRARGRDDVVADL